MRVRLCSLLLFFLFAGNGLAADIPAGSPVRMESVQADFVQEKILPILARPIISKGAFLFQAPGALRWEYFSPLPSVLLMDDGQVRKFVQRHGEFVEEKGMGLDSMQIVLQEITGWLDGNITDTPTFLAERKDGELIVLTPRDASLEKIISRIELKLQGQSGLMESVTVYEGEDSYTRMLFLNSILNTKIPAVRFTKP